jgi:hypothetical protein
MPRGPSAAIAHVSIAVKGHRREHALLVASLRLSSIATDAGSSRTAVWAKGDYRCIAVRGFHRLDSTF